MSSNSSSSSKEGGNTITPSLIKPKQISPAKRWCFTLNNYTTSENSSIVLIVGAKCHKAIIGMEDAGTPHLQGYLEFKVKARPSSVFTNKRIHWEKAKGTAEENYTYCSKEGMILYSEGWPEAIQTINRDKFYKWQEELVSLFEKPCEWDCRKIYWRYGAANIGKTQFCKWLCHHLGAVVIGGTCKHMMAQVQNANSRIYVVLLAYGDEEVSYRAIEQIKDGLFTSSFGCDNNKMTIRNAPHILVIGNEPPNRDNRNFHPTKYDVLQI